MVREGRPVGTSGGLLLTCFLKTDNAHANRQVRAYFGSGAVVVELDSCVIERAATLTGQRECRDGRPAARFGRLLLAGSELVSAAVCVERLTGSCRLALARARRGAGGCSAFSRSARANARWARSAQPLTLDRDIGKPSLLCRIGRGCLPVGRIVVEACAQRLALLAIACSTVAGIRLAFPRGVTTLTPWRWRPPTSS